MTLPIFDSSSDPGSNFVGLLTSLGKNPFDSSGASSGVSLPFDITHATTICAVKYIDGVVMAGDRRATAGNVIAHRKMDKVMPADKFSCVAISGSAGTAVEMVKLFQLQLEHYEKSEGETLSLEGKANQLSQFVKSNLGMAMQGFIVVPLFAGYDERRGIGRIFTYDATGGRYEETEYHADGSGGRDAKTTIKLGYREGMSKTEAVELLLKALYEAADEDSATGGPDLIRKIFPTVALVDQNGFRRVEDDEIETIFRSIIEAKTRH